MTVPRGAFPGDNREKAQELLERNGIRFLDDDGRSGDGVRFEKKQKVNVLALSPFASVAVRIRTRKLLALASTVARD